MNKNTIRIILVTIAYVSLFVGIGAYIVMSELTANTYGSFSRLHPSIFTASWAAAIVIVAHLAVILREKGVLRVLSVIALLFSLGLATLLVVPLGFAVG